jgi:hypothetical protein
MRGFKEKIAVMALSLMAGMASAKEAPLEVHLSQILSQAKAETAFIKVDITNHGDTALLLPRPFTPLEQMDGHLLNNIFAVKGTDGASARFVGRSIRMLPEARQQFYTRIDPGQTLSNEVSLSADYALSSGYYEISYEQGYTGLKSYRSDDEPLELAKSNTLRIYANENLIQGMKLTEAIPADEYSKPCDAQTQMPIVNRARNKVESWAFNGMFKLDDLFYVSHSTDASGAHIYRGMLKPNQTYSTWFGAPQDDSPNFPEPIEKEDVYGLPDFKPLQLTRAIYHRVNSKDTYMCGCSPQVEATPVPAWSDAADTNLIHLCSLFFRLPFEAFGADGQVTTIAHENLHFGDTYAPFIGDQPGGYGRAFAKQLALTNKSSAVSNADNYAYFLEAMNSTSTSSEDEATLPARRGVAHLGPGSTSETLPP